MKKLILIFLFVASSVWGQSYIVIGQDTSYIRPFIQNFQEPVKTSLSETGLVAAYNFQKIGATLVDISGEGNTGTVTGAYQAEGLVFASVEVTGKENYVDLDSDITMLTNSGNATIAFRYRKTRTGATSDETILGNTATDGTRYIVILNGDELTLETNTNGDLAVGTLTDVTVWNDIVITADNGTIVMYQDGVAITMVDATVTNDLTFNRIGQRDTGAGLDGEILDLRIYDVTWTSAQAIAYHNSFADDVHTKETFEGKTLSTSPDHDWTVGTGTYEVVLDTIDGTPTNVLNCSSAGTISLPSNQAYGTWEFSVYKGTGSTAPRVYFSTADIVNAGYSLVFDAYENVQLVRGASSSEFWTAVSYVLIQTWYTVKFTRTTGNVWTGYIKGGSFGDSYVLIDVTGGGGTNPTTESTYTTSNYVVVDLDADDRVANFVFTKGAEQ